ncbi:hypothetical protein HMPREF9500_00999 [Enterococcus faecalis TX0017]|nr:hypothetical protein HMPREF9500_00999 [Enterococcus faecalis TX0017]
MKIGDKKVWRKGKTTIEMERIKFDWKALIGWIGFIALICYVMKR